MMRAFRPSRPYRSKHGEKGEIEIVVFAVVIFITILISGTVWAIQWVKHNKQTEVEARRKVEQAEKKFAKARHARPDPGQYFVLCSKPFWTIFQTHYSCEILPESYTELFLTPD